MIRYNNIILLYQPSSVLKDNKHGGKNKPSLTVPRWQLMDGVFSNLTWMKPYNSAQSDYRNGDSTESLFQSR